MIGSLVGNYRVLEKLGQGGMGVVYKAVDTLLDRPVAIKMLPSELSRDASLIQRFQAEARAQAHLSHTNIATLYTLLAHEGNYFMVMEHVEGETFGQMVQRRGPIPAAEIIPLFKQALLGLGYAHRQGIIHRDIKPGNIMVNRSGIVKVMDFGIARILGGKHLTRTGTQVGTVYYMSPEQIQNKPVDIRSDIYALGVTLYEMVSGHVPFDGDSDFAIMHSHVNMQPVSPSHFYPYLPKSLEQTILISLEKNPEHRFQTVEQFGAALELAQAAGTFMTAPNVFPEQISPAGTRPPPSVSPAHPGTHPSGGESQKAVHQPDPSAQDILSGWNEEGPLFLSQESKNRLTLPIMIGAAVVVALAISMWVLYFSVEARMVRALEHGELVSPEGTSAYDLFKQLRAAGISPAVKARIRERVLPKLTVAGDALLQKRSDAENLTKSDIDQLIAIYEWAAEIANEDKRVLARNHYVQGLRALNDGKHQDALQHLRESAELDASWAPAFHDLGRTYVKLDDYSHAEECYKQAFELAPNWVYPQVNLAGVYFSRKDWGRAEHWYQKTIQTDSTYATPWYLLGQVREAQGQLSDAIEAYERAVQLASTRPSSIFNIKPVERHIDSLKTKVNQKQYAFETFESRTVSVSAERQWTETNLFFQSGSRVEIRASGSVHPCIRNSCADKRYQQWVGPEGFQNLPRLQPNGFPDMALIARVGDWGPVYVGPSSAFIVPLNGILYLGVNDGPYSFTDNTGSFVVSVTFGN